MAAVSGWDPERYQRQFACVSALAGGSWSCGRRPRARTLDLGCGTGEQPEGQGGAATGRAVRGEMGGASNIQAILDAVGAAATEAGLPAPASPWYFPTPARQAALLEGAGFWVARGWSTSRG
jgi:hypothetical protein